MKKRKKKQYGATTVEFVLVVPFVLILILASLEFTFMTIEKHLLNSALYSAARQVTKNLQGVSFVEGSDAGFLVVKKGDQASFIRIIPNADGALVSYDFGALPVQDIPDPPTLSTPQTRDCTEDEMEEINRSQSLPSCRSIPFLPAEEEQEIEMCPPGGCVEDPPPEAVSIPEIVVELLEGDDEAEARQDCAVARGQNQGRECTPSELRSFVKQCRDSSACTDAEKQSWGCLTDEQRQCKAHKDKCLSAMGNFITLLVTENTTKEQMEELAKLDAQSLYNEVRSHLSVAYCRAKNEEIQDDIDDKKAKKDVAQRNLNSCRRADPSKNCSKLQKKFDTSNNEWTSVKDNVNRYSNLPNIVKALSGTDMEGNIVIYDNIPVPSKGFPYDHTAYTYDKEYNYCDAPRDALGKLYSCATQRISK